MTLGLLAGLALLPWAPRFVRQSLFVCVAFWMLWSGERALFLSRVPYLSGAQSREMALATLRALGVTHLLENPRWLYTELRYWDEIRPLMLELQARCAEPLFRDGAGVVFVLREVCGE